jgi:dTMP kinase
MNKGMLITFEGPDGSGKTTQISMLKEYLLSRGYEVIFTREPGGTQIGEKIREIILDNNNSEMSPMCEALLYASSRAQLVHEVIKPAVESGKVVIADRFVESSIVYQGIGRNLGIERIRMINNAATDGLKPDVTFLLTIPYEEGLRRKANQRTLDRLENSGNDFHRRVYEGYMQLIGSEEYINTIDANRAVEEIHLDIVRTIEGLI